MHIDWVGQPSYDGDRPAIGKPDVNMLAENSVLGKVLRVKRVKGVITSLLVIMLRTARSTSRSRGSLAIYKQQRKRGLKCCSWYSEDRPLDFATHWVGKLRPPPHEMTSAE